MAEFEVCKFCFKRLGDHGLADLRWCKARFDELTGWHLQQFQESAERRQLERELADPAPKEGA
jgi:hypothetical protein